MFEKSACLDYTTIQHTYSEFSCSGKHRFFNVAVRQAPLHLDGGDGVHGVSAAQLAGSALGQADVPDLALLHQALQHGHGLLDGGVGVHAVLVVQVDVVGAQSLEGLSQLLANNFLLAIRLE